MDILIESTSFETSSPFSMASETAIGNQTSNGGNSIRVLGKLASCYMPFVPHMQTPLFGWSYVLELLNTFYTCSKPLHHSN
jgi:hypothetical protein